MEPHYWALTHCAIVGLFVTCLFIRIDWLKAELKKAKQDRDDWFKLWDARVEEDSAIYLGMKTRLHNMHRRAQRAEAERDRARRAICIWFMEKINPNKAYRYYYQWHKTADTYSYFRVSDVYPESKDPVIIALRKSMQELKDGPSV